MVIFNADVNIKILKRVSSGARGFLGSILRNRETGSQEIHISNT
jgi:hypothetical protein